MIQSMTGFGGASGDNFTVEIRSLNHRYLDISLKLPPFMNQYEIPLRNIIKGRFQRGRFDVSVLANSGQSVRLKINKEKAKNIHAALQELQRDLSVPGDISIEMFAQYREIIMEEEPEYDVEELYAKFDEALSNLEEMRIQEGKLLSGDILKRVEFLQEMNNRIKTLAPGEIVRWREKLTERLRLILDAGMMDNSRILQEAAIMAEKLDIAEEISRIESHLKQFLEIMKSNTLVGKKLDFLLQEIGREVNTLAYKSADYSISSLVIEMKTEIEKIREQVQNIQ